METFFGSEMWSELLEGGEEFHGIKETVQTEFSRNSCRDIV